MAEWNQNVFSKMCQAVGYNDETKDLIITWNNGTKGAYAGVDPVTAEQCSKAPSVGQYIISEIKPNYSYRKL